MIDILPNKISERFSSHAENALEMAIKNSETNSNKYIGSLHLALGILKEKGSIGASILTSSKIKISRIEEAIKSLPKENHWDPVLSTDLCHAIEMAFDVASTFKYNYLGTEHLLMGIISLSKSDFVKLLKLDSTEITNIKKRLRIIIESTARFPEIAKMFDSPFGARKDDSKEKSALEVFGSDLTDLARNGKLDLVVGREKEVNRLIDILGRKNKNNPILIGDPGVGKTAIVHRLAQKIAVDDVPESLIGKKIVSIDLALVIAGTMFRGEFESRLKEILEETADDEDVVLFIDEIHTIVGAGSASGSMDAANILKPALTQGEIQCIGATTLEEYRKFIEKDAALERRFQTILVEEPTLEETENIIDQVKHVYEDFHDVKISKQAVKAAVYMGTRYLNDRHFPDKAFDLMDEASAKVKNYSTTGQNNLAKVKQIERDKDFCISEKERALEVGDYERAIVERDKIKILQQALNDAQQIRKTTKRLSISDADIAKLISESTGIPISEIEDKELLNLEQLEKRMNERIAGQQEAVSAIVKAIRRSRAGISDPKRPIGSFMFIGPTGVGKTELAKVIAEEAFNNPKALVKIDMSEFSEKHTVSGLIGAPAGYIGHEQGGRLTEKVRRNPYSVILFDEIEKAHKDVLNILLQVMEDGVLTDASGRQVNFKNTLILITSNIGTSDFTKVANIGFMDHSGSSKISTSKDYESIKKDAIKKLRERILPEIVDRFNAIIAFNPLGHIEIEKIVKIELDKLLDRIEKQKNINIKYAVPIKKFLAKKSFAPNQGARRVRAVIQDQIEDKLTDMILDKSLQANKSYTLSLVDDKIKVSGNNSVYKLKSSN